MGRGCGVDDLLGLGLGFHFFETGDEDVEGARLVFGEVGDCGFLGWVADYTCELPGAGQDEGGEELGDLAVSAEEEDAGGHFFERREARDGTIKQMEK